MTHPTPVDYTIQPALPGHTKSIETVLDEAFGLGRQTKTSYRLREGSQPVGDLSFIADLDGRLVGSIQFWPVVIGGETYALLLGPLAVLSVYQGFGVGLRLIENGVRAAGKLGHKLVLLVGDEPYYTKAGFKPFNAHSVSMPGPFDPERLLFRELQDNAADGVSGLVLAPHRAKR